MAESAGRDGSDAEAGMEERGDSGARAETGDSDDEEDVFEVENILDSKIEEDQVLYRVRWKGYDSDADTWEPEAHLDTCKEILLEFRRKQTESKQKAAKKEATPRLSPSDIFEADSDSDTKEETPQKKKKKSKEADDRLPDDIKKKKSKSGKSKEKSKPETEPNEHLTVESKPKKRLSESREDLSSKKPRKEDIKEVKKSKKEEGKDAKVKGKDDLKEKKSKKPSGSETPSKEEMSPMEPEPDTLSVCSDTIFDEKDKAGQDEVVKNLETTPPYATEEPVLGGPDEEMDEVEVKLKKKKKKHKKKHEDPKDSVVTESQQDKKSLLKKPKIFEKLKEAFVADKRPIPVHKSSKSSSVDKVRKSLDSMTEEKVRKSSDCVTEEKVRKSSDCVTEERVRKSSDSVTEIRKSSDSVTEEKVRKSSDSITEEKVRKSSDSVTEVKSRKSLDSAEARIRKSLDSVPEERVRKTLDSMTETKEAKKQETTKEKPKKKHETEKEAKREPKVVKILKEQKPGPDAFTVSAEDREECMEGTKKDRASIDYRLPEDLKTKEAKPVLKERRSTQDETDSWTFVASEGDQEVMDSVSRMQENSGTLESKNQVGQMAMDLQLEWMTLEDFQRHLDGSDEIIPKDPIPISALKEAVKNGDYLTVKYALNSKEEYNLDQEDSSGMTLVMIAAAAGQDDILRLLIKKGAKINARQKNGTTALIHAAEKNYLTTVALLLEAGAFVNLQQVTGETALMKACKKGNYDIGRLLVEQGADCNVLSKHQGNALQFAKQSNNVLLFDLINGHIEKLSKVVEDAIKEYFETRLAVLEAIFPIACHRLCEGPDFSLDFNYKPPFNIPAESGVLLFVFHANFIGKEVVVRLCGPCSVQAVVLNDKFQLPVFLDAHFIYSFSPVAGANKLFIRLSEVPNAKVKLLISAYRVQLH